VVLSDRGEHVATVCGRKQPAVFAAALAAVARAYNGAAVLVERNNHGHAVLLALAEAHPEVRVLTGRDGKYAWLSSTLGKTALYDDLAEALRNREVMIAAAAVADQLQLIRGDTLRASGGMADDLADAFALAAQALRLARPSTAIPSIFRPTPKVDIGGPYLPKSGPMQPLGGRGPAPVEPAVFRVETRSQPPGFGDKRTKLPVWG
jgi:hypothetical protein